MRGTAKPSASGPEGRLMTHVHVRVPAVAAATALLAVAGCSAVAAPAGPSQQATLNVAVVPSTDSAGFFIALHDGLFKQEGLTVNYTPAVSSDTVINQQVAGKYDITAGTYVSYIEHAVQGQPLEIIAEGSVMQQGSQQIYTMPGSKVKTLAQLKGQLLGVNAPGNINYLLTASLLQENGISVKSVKFPAAPIPFPDMAGELAAGKIAAASMPEPFATAAEEKYGVVPLADLDQGATQNFPIAGYVATRSWAHAHPVVLKEFLTALKQGQEIADTNRGAVEQAMETLNGPQNGQVPPIIAAVMPLNNYPIGINKPGLQRVADAMFQYGLLHTRFNVSQMIAP
jgi:NitT/TauT family transport system substrate-binding protein